MKTQNPYSQNRKKITLYVKHPARTKQSFKDECNIKNILNQYNKTGLVTHLNTKKPQHIDHSSLPNYQDSLNFTTHIQQQFDQLPQDLKKRFNNDLNEFSTFLSDPNNLSEAQKLGLIAQDDPNIPYTTNEQKETPTTPPNENEEN